MNLLFKLTSAETKESVIGDSNFKDHFPSINQKMSWASIKPYLRQATREYIIPFLGETFYTDVFNYFEAELAGQLESKIIELLQDAISYYTIYDAMPHINRVISDMGVQENNSENNTSSPSSQWRYKNSRWETMIKADKLMDQVLALMEKNKGDAFLANWIISEEYKAGNEFFRNTNDISEFLNIQKSRRAFLALTPYIKKAIQIQIIPAITKEQYDDLIVKISAGSCSAQEKILVEKIKYALAEWAFYMAIPHIRIAFDGSSIVFVTSTDGMNMRKDAYESAIQDLKQRVLQDANVFLADLKSFIYENVDDFALYKASGYVEYYADNVISSTDKIGGILIH